METRERQKPRPCRSFTPEFKAEIVSCASAAIAAWAIWPETSI